MNQPSHNNAQIIMYTTNWCPDCHRAKYLLDEYGIAYKEIDIEKDPVGLAFVKQVNNGNRVVPTILFPDNTILVEPSTAALAKKAGFDL